MKNLLLIEKQATKVCLIEYNKSTSSGAYELKREYASTSDLITHTPENQYP